MGAESSYTLAAKSMAARLPKPETRTCPCSKCKQLDLDEKCKKQEIEISSLHAALLRCVTAASTDMLDSSADRSHLEALDAPEYVNDQMASMECKLAVALQELEPFEDVSEAEPDISEAWEELYKLRKEVAELTIADLQRVNHDLTVQLDWATGSLEKSKFFATTADERAKQQIADKHRILREYRESEQILKDRVEALVEENRDMVQTTDDAVNRRNLTTKQLIQATKRIKTDSKVISELKSEVASLSARPWE